MAMQTRSRQTLASQFVLTTALLVGSGCNGTKGPGAATSPPAGTPKAAEMVVTAIPFGERNEEQEDVYNASDIVPLEDGHFLVVDNNTNDALLDLRLTPDGKQAAPIARRPLVGLPAKTVDDVEDLTLVEEGGHRYVFAAPSLSIKAGSKKKGKEQKVRPGGLLRIAIAADGTLNTEAMPGFRDWFVSNVKEIRGAANNDPEYGGLNIEGLEWDTVRHALLFGVRTPVLASAPMVVPIRIKDLAGPWNESNLEALPAIRLAVEPAVGDQGIRGMSPGPGGRGFLLTVANATSDDEAPFSLYRWDGNAEGTVTRLPVAFAKKMKPEGLTVGSVGGKPALVFVDDGGGFQVVWLDSIPGLAS
jgi:hypothetical protein